MAVIFYLPAYEERGEELLNRMMVELPQQEVETYRCFPDLRWRLQCPFPDIRVAVLLCMSQADLQEIFSLGEFLQDLKIILVLPDDDTETIIKAHNLRPRYLSWLDNNFFDIVTVLKRMVDLYGAPLVREEGTDVRKIRSGHRKVLLKELTVMKGGRIRQWN
jgi:hypothetical protein